MGNHITLRATLVFSRRFSSEKSPTITVASFFFVRPHTSSCMYHFLVQTLLGLRWTQRSRVRVLTLARNFFEHLRKRTRRKAALFQFFSALCDYFFDFFRLQRVPHSSFFWYFAANFYVSPFKYFGTMRLFKILIFRFFFREFFCLQRVSLNFFDILQQTGFSKSPKGLLFYSFENFALFKP